LCESRSVVVTVAGLPDGEDSRLIRFWPWTRESIDSVLAFADFLIDSHRYVLWLSGRHRGDVSLLHGSEPEPPIGSFAEFLAAYLADDPVSRPSAGASSASGVIREHWRTSAGEERTTKPPCRRRNREPVRSSGGRVEATQD
jgi:hypothetical protein